MIIDKIDNYIHANLVFITPFRIVASRTLLPLDAYTYTCIINNDFDVLKNCVESNTETYDEHVANYRPEGGALDVPSNYGIPEYETLPNLVFPFSKTKLINEFFPDVLPNIVNTYLSFMKESNRLLQLGFGVGKCFFIKANPFTEEEFNIIQKLDLDYQMIVKLMVSATSQIVSQQNDIKYLTRKNKEANTIISTSDAVIATLQNNIINNSISTWR